MIKGLKVRIPGLGGEVLAEFTARNSEALQTLAREHGVLLRPFPADVLKRLRELSEPVIAEGAARDPLYARVHESVRAFQARSSVYLGIANAPGNVIHVTSVSFHRRGCARSDVP